MTKCNRDQTTDLVRKDCETWPEAEQVKWMELFDPADPEREIRWAMRSELPWVRETQYTCAAVYSRYLDCVRRHDLPEAVTPEGLVHFIEEAESREVVARTVAGYVKCLTSVVALLYPERSENLGWLRITFFRINAVAERQPKKKSQNKRLFSAKDLFRLGAQLVAEALAAEKMDWSSVQMFRDGLWFLLGGHCPEREKALDGLKVSHVDLVAAKITFPALNVKTKGESHRIVSPLLREAIRVWLDVYRAHYDPSHDGFWIVSDGGHARWGTMTAAMRSATRKHLGVEISTHRFRDAAATFVIEELPERAALASMILKHKNRHTTEEYTETARQLTASRKVAEHLDAAEREVTREVRRQHRRSSIGRGSGRKRVLARRMR